MRIAIDASAILPRPSGARTRMIALLRAYRRARGARDVVAFVARGAGLDGPLAAAGIECVEVEPPPPPIVRLARGSAVWRARLAAVRADAFSAETLPPAVDVGVPVSVTLHDLRDLGPDASRLGPRALYARHLLPAALRRVERIVAVSEWTKRDVERRLGVPGERIDVVPNGVDPSFVRPDEGAVFAWRRARDVPERYVLALGHLEPRKNLGVLVDAVRALRAAAWPDLGLVLAGRDAGGERERLLRLAAKAPSVRVTVTGSVDDAERCLALAGAAVVATPSTLEGFGLVPLEAMAAGVPTVSSTEGALPEVVGSAGLLVPAHDPQAWAAVISRVLGDQKERARLVEAGHARAAAWSWDDAAAALVRSHDALLRASPRSAR